MTEPENEQEQTPGESGKRFDIPWLVNSGLVTLVAIFLRFYWLELKPLHHDEGVNGYFLTRLFREGVYKYDPSNYHGPDLYYIALAFTKVFGLNTLSIRWSVAVFGVLTVVLALFLRRWIGKTGALAAGLFLALSPGMVYISRYFIHEILFVFFSLSFVVSILYFIERKRPGIFAIGWMTLLLLVCFLPPAVRLPSVLGVQDLTWQWGLGIAIFAVEAALVFLVMRMLLHWNRGRPVYLLLASASAILLFATKETAFITIGTMAIAWACVRVWQKISLSDVFLSKRMMALWALQIGLPVAVGVIVVTNFTRLSEGFSSLSDFFLKAPSGQAWVLYAVAFLTLAAGLVLLIYIASERSGGVSEDTPASEPSFLAFRSAIGSRLDLILVCAGCFFVFAYVGVLFFSSFFTYPEGVVGAFEAYAIWTKTGSSDHTQNGTFAYVRWLMETESPLLVIGLLGAVIAWLRGSNRFAFFSGLWAFGLLAAYSIIPYKTPWLSLSFMLPMGIAAGYGIGRLVASNDAVLKVSGVVLAVVGSVILAFQSYDLNFVRYDDDRMPYVYAHTRRGFEDLMSRVKEFAEASPRKKEAAIDIVSPEYWPMPWYLNDYPNAVFHGQLIDASQAEMIIGSKAQVAELEKRYYGTHYLYGTYPLRPGVELYLLVRKDLPSLP